MSRGGAREGSGRKPKFLEHGQEQEGRTIRVPKEISNDEINQAIKDLLIKKQQKHKQN